MTTIIANHRKTLFNNLSPIQSIDYILLLFTTATLVISWNIALYFIYALVANSIVRCFSERGHRKPKDRWHTLSMLALICFATIYWVSLLYSSNIPEGVEVSTKKLPFILIPIYFLISDHSYIQQTHLRHLFWTFGVIICLRFEVRFILTLVHYFGGQASIGSFFSGSFDSFHHSYLTMYILLAMVFAYGEIKRKGKDLSTEAKWIIGVMATELTLYNIMIQSRAGILMMILFLVYIIWDIIVINKHYRLGIICVGTALLIALLSALFFPRYTTRLTDTITEVAEGNHDDARFGITQTALMAINDNLPMGVGVGDRIDVMEDYFMITRPSYAKSHYNPHNQYNDTLLTTGILGFIILLACLIIPLMGRTHNEDAKRWKTYRLALVLITACSCLFESIFERQMGILFYCFFIGVLMMPAATDSSAHNNVCEPYPHKDL